MDNKEIEKYLEIIESIRVEKKMSTIDIINSFNITNHEKNVLNGKVYTKLTERLNNVDPSIFPDKLFKI